MSLEVKLRKTFGGLRKRSFELDVEFVGEIGITVLFGSSGSGKTSVLDCIAGLTSPNEGFVRLNERALFDSAKRIDVPTRHRAMGYVFQTSALFPTLTVLDNVQFGMSEANAREAQRLLDQFKVAHLAQQRPNQLSGGEKQRVALARTFAAQPKAILLDEPFSGLDDYTKFELTEILREWITKKQMPVLYVTHAIEEVFLLGSRVIVVHEGKIVKQGVPREVLAEEKQRLVAVLA